MRVRTRSTDALTRCLGRGARARTVLSAGLLAALTWSALPRLIPRQATPALAATLPAASAGGLLGAYLIAQPADCEGNLAFLALLKRPEIARGVALRGILLAGSERDLLAIRSRPAIRRLAVPVERLQPAMWRTLSALGVRDTPYFLVLSPRGEVRLAVRAPNSPQSHVRLARLLTVLGSSPE